MLYFSDERGDEYRGKAIFDDNPENPRDNENIATMYLYWPRMTLGDAPFTSARAVLDVMDGLIHDIDESVDTSEFKVENYVDFLSKHDYVVKVVYGYEHSGFTISASNGYPFSDRWDGGVCGFVFVTKDDIKAEGLSLKDWRKTAESIIDDEVNEYDLYLRGEMYAFVIEKKIGDEDIYEDDNEMYEEYETYYGLHSDKSQRDMEEDFLEETFGRAYDVEYRESEMY